MAKPMDDHGMSEGPMGVVRSIHPKSMVASLKQQSIINTKLIDWNHKELAITWQDPLQPHGQMRSLPHQGAKHDVVDHGDASDDVFHYKKYAD
jgi:hypothetical protein